jgi:TRAP-type C4-dicarboxylate transport system substrate-binding protein
MRTGVWIGILLFASTAMADPVVLRVATAAPDGTEWARALKSMGDRVEMTTHGGLRLKWYFGGVVGDEFESAERMKKGQIDGVASGGPLCDRIAPSMRVLGIPGLFRNRDETAYVMHSLFPSLVEEAAQNGYALLVTSGLGSSGILSRRPVRSMTELRAINLWAWDLIDYEIYAERAMGLKLVPAGVLQASHLYETKAIDGFLAIPTGALAFQWTTQGRYYTDLRVRYLTSCVVVINRAFDRLPVASQEALRQAFTEGDLRLEALNRRMDDQLLGGLFEHQGVTMVPVSETFRAQFFEAARQARENLGAKLVPTALLDRVLQLIVDYRSEHEGNRRR